MGKSSELGRCCLQTGESDLQFDGKFEFIEK